MNFLGDQAEGLRRALGRKGLRVTMFVSGLRRSGKTTALANIALAGAQMGRNILVLDENRSAFDVAATCGVTARYDLLDAMQGGSSLEQVIVPGPEGMMILPAGRAVRANAEMDDQSRIALAAGFERLVSDLDWLLVDAASGFDTRLLPLALSAQDVVVVMPEDGDGLTRSYAMMKLIRQEFGLKRFRLIGTRARGDVRLREQSRRLTVAAKRYLDATVDYVGCVPFDDAVKRSMAQARPLMSTFPRSSAGAALRAHAEQLLHLPSQSHAESPVSAFLQRLIEGSRVDFAAAALA